MAPNILTYLLCLPIRKPYNSEDWELQQQQQRQNQQKEQAEKERRERERLEEEQQMWVEDVVAAVMSTTADHNVFSGLGANDIEHRSRLATKLSALKQLSKQEGRVGEIARDWFKKLNTRKVYKYEKESTELAMRGLRECAVALQEIALGMEEP